VLPRVCLPGQKKNYRSVGPTPFPSCTRPKESEGSMDDTRDKKQKPSIGVRAQFRLPPSSSYLAMRCKQADSAQETEIPSFILVSFLNFFFVFKLNKRETTNNPSHSAKVPESKEKAEQSHGPFSFSFTLLYFVPSSASFSILNWPPTQSLLTHYPRTRTRTSKDRNRNWPGLADLSFLRHATNKQRDHCGSPLRTAFSAEVE